MPDEASAPAASTETATTIPDARDHSGRTIAGAAVLIAAGNVASRIFGQIRESVTSWLFGATGSVDVSAYAIASRVPTTLYDFIVGGLVSAALVPVFAELAEHDERELGDVVGTIFSTVTLAMLAVATAAWIFAPQIGTLLTLTVDTLAYRRTTIELIRWMLPATVLMAGSGLLTGLLQARKQFLLPAFATTVFNLGIIVSAWLLHDMLQIRSLAAGMILGAALQVLLQLPGLRGVHPRAGFRLRHPAVVRIAALYAPVLVGLSFALVGTAVDAALASGLGQGAAAIMRYATTLIQLSLGIISTAVSLAALPTLARQAGESADEQRFRRTLSLSLQVVLFLILPATALLAVLAQPIVLLLFQQGAFGPADTAITARALLFYLPSLVAAAVDQPLIFAFYARKNTLLPNLVNGAAIATYLVVAFATVADMGVYGLILANGLQWAMHAALMVWLAHRRLNAIRGQGIVAGFVGGTIASAAAGSAGYGLLAVIGGAADTKLQALSQIMVVGCVMGAAYLGMSWLLGVRALELLSGGIRQRLGRD